jgi:SAM-dependent MidA family methyltransferase
MSVSASQFQSDSSEQGNALLVQFIREQIQQCPEGRVTFATFMDWALYHPRYGYYTRRREKIGAKGDFFTSPHLALDFGELLAEQFADMWQALSCPQPFTLVEMGAGQGLLAADVLSYLQRQHPDCFAALQYCIIEKAAAHIAEQQQRLRPWQDRLTWTTLDAIAPFTGCCFSNELVDAFPVHCVTWKDQTLQEVYVTDALTEVVGDLSNPDLSAYFAALEIDFRHHPDGYRTEVNLAALDWMKQVSDRLHRGYCLTIDYGYLADRYYNPRRSQGTLQCYYQHRHHSDPYLYIGEQDITTHVDFTSLQRQDTGLTTVGFTQQGLFLMSLGLGDRLSQISQTEATSTRDLQDRLQRRDALHQLINPMGLGGFGVLIQSKGLTRNEQLQSLKGLEGERLSGAPL